MEEGAAVWLRDPVEGWVPAYVTAKATDGKGGATLEINVVDESDVATSETRARQRSLYTRPRARARSDLCLQESPHTHAGAVGRNAHAHAGAVGRNAWFSGRNATCRRRSVAVADAQSAETDDVKRCRKRGVPFFFFFSNMCVARHHPRGHP